MPILHPFAARWRTQCGRGVGGHRHINAWTVANEAKVAASEARPPSQLAACGITGGATLEKDEESV
eukprot:15452582-Alexandrium_andersonii.AAC.1